jgi:hypothetical protein
MTAGNGFSEGTNGKRLQVVSVAGRCVRDLFAAPAAAEAWCCITKAVLYKTFIILAGAHAAVEQHGGTSGYPYARTLGWLIGFHMASHAQWIFKVKIVKRFDG